MNSSWIVDLNVKDKALAESILMILEQIKIREGKKIDKLEFIKNFVYHKTPL